MRSDMGAVISRVLCLAATPAKAADFGGHRGAATRFDPVKPAVAAKLRVMQAAVHDPQTKGLMAKGQGCIGVGLKVCILGVGPCADLVASFLVRIEPSATFRSLMRAVRPAKRLGSNFLQQMQSCTAAHTLRQGLRPPARCD